MENTMNIFIICCLVLIAGVVNFALSVYGHNNRMEERVNAENLAAKREWVKTVKVLECRIADLEKRLSKKDCNDITVQPALTPRAKDNVVFTNDNNTFKIPKKNDKDSVDNYDEYLKL